MGYKTRYLRVQMFESDERELELNELADELELETELELELELDESDRDGLDLPERAGLFSILKAFDARKQITKDPLLPEQKTSKSAII